MCEREDGSGKERGKSGIGHDAQDPGKEVSLQQQLLRESPDSVACVGSYPSHGAAGMVQRVHAARKEHGAGAHEQSHPYDPPGFPEPRNTAAESSPSLKRETHGNDEPAKRDEVEPVLEGAVRPDHRKDEPIADDGFRYIPC